MDSISQVFDMIDFSQLCFSPKKIQFKQKNEWIQRRSHNKIRSFAARLWLASINSCILLGCYIQAGNNKNLKNSYTYVYEVFKHHFYSKADFMSLVCVLLYWREARVRNSGTSCSFSITLRELLSDVSRNKEFILH